MHRRWTLFVLCILALGPTLATGQTPAKREEEHAEISVLSITPLEGQWSIEHDCTMQGKLYDLAATMYATADHVGMVTLPNRAKYDYFEATIGCRNARSNGTAQFRVRGDGKILYTSPVMSGTDPPVHIRVPIRGCSAFMLSAAGRADEGWIVWANPRLVKLPPHTPVAVSPEMDETIKRSTPLVWKAVDEATGYLLELQCVELRDPKDENHESRFQVLRFPAETTLYVFAVDKMPKGKWRWRVHALNKTAILGEMEEWYRFTVQ